MQTQTLQSEVIMSAHIIMTNIFEVERLRQGLTPLKICISVI